MDFRKIIIATLVGTLWCGVAIAFEGEFKNIRGTAKSLYDAELSFEYDAKWELQTLMGEPLRKLQIRWRFPIFGKIVGKDLTPFEGYKNSFLVSDLPANIRAKIRIYGVKVRVSVARSNIGKEANITFDAGVPDKAGMDWSYNVTGSPSWEKFMTYIGTHEALSVEKSKTLMKSEILEGRSAETMQAKVHLGEVLRWLRRKSDKEPVRTMIKGAREHIEVLDSVLGLPTRGLEMELGLLEEHLNAASSIKELDKVRKRVASALLRLDQGIPIRYQVPKLKAYYSQLRAEIRKWVSIQTAELEKALNDSDESKSIYEKWKKTKNIELAAALKKLKDLQARSILIPQRDGKSGLYGYVYENNKMWAIKPRFEQASKFDKNGHAVVGVDTKYEKIRVKKIARCTKKTYYKDVTIMLSRSIRIDKSGKYIPKGDWRKQRTGSGFHLTTGKCK